MNPRSELRFGSAATLVALAAGLLLDDGAVPPIQTKKARPPTPPRAGAWATTFSGALLAATALDPSRENPTAGGGKLRVW